MPIAREPIAAPVTAVCFVTNAAGLPANEKWSGDVGSRMVAFNDEGSMIHAAQYFWPKQFVSEKEDSPVYGMGTNQRRWSASAY